MPVWGSVSFQNGVSGVMEQLIFFHDHVMVVMIIVMVFVGYILVMSFDMGFYSLMIQEGQEMELIWTIIPGLVLMFIAFPSLRLLYLMEEMGVSGMMIKITGFQWFWTYEYSDLVLDDKESFMKLDYSLMRLMEVSEDLVLPFNVGIKGLVSSMDVIHSWTVPSLGVSVDAVPGRLNQILWNFNRSGVYVGQCSEICGVNHSFMPIIVNVVSWVDFIKMVN